MVKKFAFYNHFYSFLRLFNYFFLKNWDNLNLLFFLFLLNEMPLLNRNEIITCPECGTEYTRLHASRHQKHRGVLKCSNCNFYTCRRNLLIISRKSIVNIMLNHVLSSLKTHSREGKIDIYIYILKNIIENTLNNNFFTETEKTIQKI